MPEDSGSNPTGGGIFQLMDIEQTLLYNCYFVESCQTGPSTVCNFEYFSAIGSAGARTSKYFSVETRISVTYLHMYLLTHVLTYFFTNLKTKRYRGESFSN